MEVGVPEVGAALGLFAAAVVAAWRASIHSIRKKVEEPHQKEITALQEQLKAIREAHQSLIKALDKMDQRADNIESRLAKSVTDEEFSAYVGQTTQTVNSLSEKVGRVTGALEARWSRRDSH